MLPADDFSDFEKSVLHAIRDRYKDAALTAQIDAAAFKRRDWTKVGYYIYFDVPGSLAPVTIKYKLKDKEYSWPIDGPMLPESSEIAYGGWTLLWGKGGYIGCLEMVSNGSHFAEDPSPCDLSQFYEDLRKRK